MKEVYTALFRSCMAVLLAGLLMFGTAEEAKAQCVVTFVDCPSDTVFYPPFPPQTCTQIVNWDPPSATNNGDGACLSANPLTVTQVAGPTPGTPVNVGVYTIIYHASDASGASASCSFTVTVADTVNPTITGCPGDQTMDQENDTCGAHATWLAPVGSDACGIASFEANTNPLTGQPYASGDFFPVGLTTVIYTATDLSGNTTTCGFDITVNDTSAPVITFCPGNVTQTADPGVCDAAVVVPDVEIDEDCPAAVTFTQTGATTGGPFAGVNASGTYNVGVTTVTFNVDDGSGGTTSCFFTVTITDDEAPTIDCSAAGSPINVSNDAGLCGSTQGWLVTASDNCEYTITNDFNAQTSVNAPLAFSDFFPVGTTVVTFTATDDAGLTATCSVSVTVTDDEAPTMACNPSGAIIGTDDPNCFASVLVTAGAADNCAIDFVTNDHNLDSTGTFTDDFVPGSYTITFTAHDEAGNTSSCEATFTVEDDDPPVLNGCNDSTIYVDANCDATLGWTVTATDNCDPAPVVSQTGGLPPGTVVTVGTFVITYQAVDAAGNTGTCEFTITVEDTTSPTITCPGNITVNNDPGLCEAAVVVPAPTTDDNCGVASIENDYNFTADASDTYPVGTTTVIWTVTDDNGNTATCSHEVTVIDVEPPFLACEPDPMLNTSDDGLGDCSTTNPNPSFFYADNCEVEAIGHLVNAFGDTILSDTTILLPQVVPTPVGFGYSYPAGVNTLHITLTDPSGNTAFCIQTVTVTDDEDPAIACPGPIATTTEPDTCGAHISFNVTASDNCMYIITNDFNGQEDTNQTQAFNDFVPGGVTTIVFTVTDSFGNTATCDVEITIEDEQPPTVICPQLNDQLTSTNDVCFAVVGWSDPAEPDSLFDNCAGPIFITQTTGMPNPGVYAVGTYTIEYLATDQSGNTATCGFTFSVIDTARPEWTNCPNDTVVFYDEAQCGQTVVWQEPTPSDNCVGVYDSSTHVPGDFFPVGTTTVVYTAYDSSGNTSQCSFTVTVVDTVPPTIVCQSPDTTLSTDPGECTAVYFYDDPVVDDDCDSSLSGSGQLTTLFAENNGNSVGGAVYFDVTNQTGSTLQVTGMEVNASSSSNVEVYLTSTPGTWSGNTGNAGAWTLVATGTMTSYNGVDNPSPVSISFGIPPGTTGMAVVMPSAQSEYTNGSNTYDDGTLAINTGAASNVPFDGSPFIPRTWNGSITYSTGQSNLTVTQTSGLPSGSDFPLGTTTNTFLVTDSSGNTATCSFDVTVEDNEDPVFTSCPVDMNVGTDPGDCFATVNYTVTATDNCSVTVTQTSGLPSGSQFPIGTTTNSFIATDTAGNTATCSFDITVTDDEDPTITGCPNDTVVPNEPDMCSAAVSWVEPTVFDNCGIAVWTSTHSPGDVFPVGTTTVVYTAEDIYGNTAECTFDVTVEDVQDPIIVCSDTIFENDPGKCYTSQLYDLPFFDDNCPGAFLTLLSGPAQGDTLPVGGPYTVEYMVTDTGGNTASCSFTITVLDTENPTTTCPNDTVVVNDPGVCGAEVTYTPPFPADNCITSTVTQIDGTGLTSGDTFPVGITNQLYIVEDAAGNTITCGFTVTVLDTEAPVWANCPADTTVVNDPGECGAIVTYTAPTMSDNCGATTTNSHNPGDFFPVGTTTVTYMAVDTSGNTAMCSFTVTVEDTEGPSITCPADITVSADPGVCEAVVTFPYPATVDNCFMELSFYDFETGPQGWTTGQETGSTNNFWNVYNTTAASGNNSLGTANDGSNNIPFGREHSFMQSPPFEVNGGMVEIAFETFINNEDGTTFDVEFIEVSTDGGATWTIVHGVPEPGLHTGVTTSTWTPMSFVAAGAPAGTQMMFRFRYDTFDDFGGAPDGPPIGWYVDNVSISASSPIPVQTAGLPSGSSFPVGTTTNVFMVTDNEGHTATCSFDVTVEDNEDPVITGCPADMTVSTDPGSCDAEVSWTEPTASDNCAVTSWTSTHNPGDVFPLGTTTVTYTAMDAAGNSATCSFTITVEDNEAPIVTCPADMTFSAEPGTCGATVTFNLGSAGSVTLLQEDMESWPGALSNPDGSASYNGWSNANGSTGPDWSVDANGTGSSNTGPDVDHTLGTSLGQYIYLETSGGSSGSSDELLSPAIDVSTVSNATVSFWYHMHGATMGTLALEASTDGSTWTQVFSISGEQHGDETDPWTQASVNVDAFTGGDLYLKFVGVKGTSFSGDMALDDIEVTGSTPSVTFSDNCPGEVLVQTGGLPPGSTYPVGTTTNTFMVTDAAGNTATCSFDVTITDDEAPTISCPSDITVANDTGVCGAVVTYTVTGADNCPGEVLTITAGMASGSTFPVGTTTVAWMVTDASGNTATCSFDVTVEDTEAPTVSCPPDTTLTADPGECEADFSYVVPFADNCPNATITYIGGGGMTTNIDKDTTYVLYGATDSSLHRIDHNDGSSFTVGSLGAHGDVRTIDWDDNGGLAGGTIDEVILNVCNAVDDFAGYYAPGNWTFQNIPAGVSGSVNTSGAPASIELTGGNNSTGGSSQYTITIPCAGTVSFDWSYTTTDGPNWDPFGYVLNGNFVELTNSGGPNNQSGSETINVIAGDVFGFDQQTADGFFGPGITTISNFSGTESSTVVVGGASNSILIDQWTAAETFVGSDVRINSSYEWINGTLYAVQLNPDTDLDTLHEQNFTGQNGKGATGGNPISIDLAGVNWTIDVSGTSMPNNGDWFRVENERMEANDVDGPAVWFSEPIDIQWYSSVNFSLLATETGNLEPTDYMDIAYSTDGGANWTTITDWNGLGDGTHTFIGDEPDDDDWESEVVSATGLSGSTLIIRVTMFNDNDSPGEPMQIDDLMITGNPYMVATLGTMSGGALSPVAVVTPPNTLPTDGMAYDPTSDVLYAISMNSLYTLDYNTGVATLVGNTGVSGLSTLDYNAEDGMLYASGPSGQLYTINAANGSASLVASTGLPLKSVTWIPVINIASDAMVSGSYPVGTTTEEFFVIDAAGNTTSCSFDITVTDDELPTISCPADIVVNNAPGQCDALVNYVTPIISDNCPDASVSLVSGLGSGSFFPVGTTTEVWMATDASGNTATCSFTVTVIDNEPPTISCFPDIVASNDPGDCGAIVDFTQTLTLMEQDFESWPCCLSNPNGTATYDGWANANGFTTPDWSVDNNGTTSGSTGPDVDHTLGTSSGTYVYLETSTGAGTGSFDMLTSPSIDLSTVVSAEVSFWYHMYGSSMGTLELEVSDDGVNWTQVFSITGQQHTSGTDPWTQVAIDVSAYVGGDLFLRFVGIRGTSFTGDMAIDDILVTGEEVSLGATSMDNCPGDTITQVGGLPSGSFFPVGTTVNTFMVTDAAGNTATCSFTVTVEDDEAPTVTCPPDTTVLAELGLCGATVSLDMPIGSDNCAVDIITNDFNGTVDASGFYPVGNTTVVWTVFDSSGNTATCAQVITVIDDQDPTIACPADIVVPNDPGVCEAFVTVPSPVSSDNCPFTVTNDYNGTADASDDYPVGTTTVVFTIEDESGNTATCSLDITVEDNEVPTITCPNDTVVGTDPGLCGAIVQYDFPVATDNCPGTTVTLVQGQGSLSLFPIGTTTNIYMVTDAAGHTATCSFTVTVEDTEPPTISGCPSNILVSNDPGDCGAIVTWIEPVPVDPCPGATISGTASPGDFFPVGTTTVVYTATDGAGNTATCSFDITVQDTEAPVISGCPTDIATCDPVVTWTAPTATDNCNLDTLIGSHTSGSTFPIGTTTVVYTATDDAGNVATCSFTITVNPLPTADAGSDVDVCSGSSVTIGGNPTGSGTVGPYTYSWAPAGSLDDPSLANPSASPTATTTYTVTVTDDNGCTDTDEVTVTVNPLPTADAGLDQTICLNESVAIGGNPTASGTVGPYTFDWAPATGLSTTNAANPVASPTATTTYTVTVTDANGCVSTDVVTVTVNPLPNATITAAGPFCENEGPQTLNAATPGGTWSGNGITDPASGTFNPAVAGVGTHQITYMVTDANGCSNSANTLITVLAIPDARILAVGPLCEDDDPVFLTGLPNINPHTWSGPGVDPSNGQFDPAAAGAGSHVITYIVTNANGCTDTATATIVVHAQPVVVIQTGSPFCELDPVVTLTASVPGGIWSGPGIIQPQLGEFLPIAAGAGVHDIDYTVTNANGCEVIETVQVTVFEVPAITSIVTEASCQDASDGAIDITVTGGTQPNYDYLWSNGETTEDLTGVAPGTYTVTVTDGNGCAQTASITVGISTTPVVAQAVIDQAFNHNTPNGSINLTVSGGVSPYDYLWSNGETTEDIDSLLPGNYTVVIIDAAGCSYTFTYNVPSEWPVGIDLSELDKNISLYPNPTSDVINVDIEVGAIDADMTMTVYDVLGRKLYEVHDAFTGGYQHQIEMQNWASGHYMIRFDINGQQLTKKFILAK